MGLYRAMWMVFGAAMLVGSATATSAETASADTGALYAAATASAAQVASKSASAAAASALAAATAASKAESAVRNAWAPPNVWVLYLVPVFVLVASTVAIRKVAVALLPTSWSLSDALSEEVMMPVYVQDQPANSSTPAAQRTLLLDDDRKPILVPEMHASSSRVIALMGMMAILFLFLGFGVFAIFEFGNTGKVSDNINGVVSFLMSGLTLFAPYVANKFASIFKVAPVSK